MNNKVRRIRPLSLSLLGVPIYFVDILIVLFHFPCAFYTSRFFRYVFVGCSFLFFTFYYFFLCVCVSYPFDVVVTEGAPALLRRWGGNGPIGWRANVSPWFHTPLFGSSFSIDDGFGTVGTKFLFFYASARRKVLRFQLIRNVIAETP